MFGGDGSGFVDLHAASAGFDLGGDFTVPAEFLFHGEYRRAGNDLKIIGEHGKIFVVHDYFKTDQLHTLFAPDGAALTGDIVAALAGPLAPGQYAQATPPQGNAQPVIGRVATEQGTAIAVRNGVAVTLNVGDAVLKGDVIQTEGNSAVGIIFGDGSTFDLGANARMVLNEFVYNPAPGSANSSFINLVQGSITFIAGEVAHTGDMKVGTPSATMGIRGTAVHADIDVNNGTTTVKLQVLIEPGGRVGSFNIYSLSGQLIGTVDHADTQTVVTAAGPLAAVATVVALSPEQVAQALTAVQTAFQTKAVGDAILAAQPVPPSPQSPNPNPTPQQPDQNQQNNQPLNQNPTQNTPKSQITSTDVSTTKIAIDTTGTPTITPPTDNTPPTTPLILAPTPSQPQNPPQPPPSPPPAVNTPPFFEVNSANTVVHVSNPAQPVQLTGVLQFTDTVGDSHTQTPPVVIPHAGNVGSLNVSVSQDTSGSSEGAVAYAYTAPAGQSQPQDDVFDVTVTDAANNTATTQISFVLQDHPPVANLATYTVTETQIASANANAPFVLQNILARGNVSDADGDTVTVTAITAPTVNETSAGLSITSITAESVGAGEVARYDIQTNSGNAHLAVGSDGQVYLWSDSGGNPFQGLGQNETATINFSYIVADGFGGGAGAQAVITINGANDAAVVSGTSSGAVTEAGGVSNATPGTPTATGTLTDTDVDNPANTFQAVAAGTASDNAYGSYAMAAGGAWTYTLNNNNAAVQALNVGGTLTDTFTVHTADGTAQQVTVTINGANDAAVVSGTSSGAVTEAGGVSNATPGTPTATGTLTDTDVDNPANTFQAVAAGTASDNAYGSYAMAAGGAWTYTLNNNNAAVQALNVGGTLTDTFTVHTADGTAQQVTVTINGANDAPVLTLPGTSASINANTSLPLTGAHVVDPDAGDVITLNLSVLNGSLTPIDVTLPAGITVDSSSPSALQVHGSAAAIDQLLNDGVTYTPTNDYVGGDTLTVAVHDTAGASDSKQVAITVNSVANQPAVVSGTSSGAVTEAGGVSNATPGTPTATGTLTDTDVDNPANTFQAVAAGTASDNAYGSYAMAAGGAWTYTLNNNNAAVQALNVGGTLTDTFTVHTADGTAQQVTVTINGANDAAVVSGTSSGAVTEAGGVSNATPGTPTATGTLTDTDVDNPANTFQAVAAGTASDNAYGSYAMAAGGAWTYTLNNNNAAVQALNVGGTLTDTFTVHTADGTAQQVTVTINGTNDAAVVSGTSSGAVTEAGGVSNATPGTPTATGTLTDTDVDNPANTFQAVAAGTASDNAYGSYAMAAGGAWTYTLNNNNAAVQALNVGGTLTDTFTVHTADGTAQQVTVTINGANDAAVVSGTSSGAVTEAGGVSNATPGTPTATGTLTDTDVDNPANTFQAVAAGTASDNAYGSYAMAAGGAWTYTLNNNNAAVQALNVGGTLTDTFTVHTADGTAQQVTVTINGANDAAVVSGTSSGAVTEAGGVNNGTPGTPTFSGTLTDTDVDNPANTFQAVAAGTASDNAYGSYAMAAGGAWTYTLNNNNAAVQALNVGGTLTDTFTVHTADGTAQQVTVTINGANDAAVVSGTSSGAVTEAGGVNNGTPGTPTFSGTLTDTDVDNPANTFQAVAAGTASDNAYGSYAMAAGGTWTYTLNNNNAAVQALNAGGTLSDTFTVHTQDGTAQQVTVTINGANDAPVAVNDTNTITAGNGPISGNLLANDSDPENDTLTVTNLINDASGGGTITVDGAYGEVVVAKATGNYTYTLGVTPNEAAAVAALAAGAQGQEDFIYTVSDGNGGTADAHLTIAVTGVNDAPVVNLTPIISEVPIPNPLPAGTDAAAQQEVAPVISQDGRWVAFFSSEINPDTNNGNNNSPGDVYLYDRQTGTTTVLTDAAHTASLPAGETFGNGLVSISADGNTVVFRGRQEVADPQSPTGSDQTNQIFIYDHASDTVRMLTNPDNNNTPYNVDDTATISGAGNRLVFESFVPNNNGPPTVHVYVTDLSGHLLTDITSGQLGILQPSDPSQYIAFSSPDISSNGRYLTFWAETRSTGNGTDTPVGQETLYTYDRSNGTSKIIATTTATNNDWPASMSNDGSLVVFQSDVLSGNGQMDIFVWNRNTNTTTDITALANGNSERATISANGHVVIFASDATNLVPGDTNGLGDTFAYDLQAQTFQLLSVAMDGTQGNGDSTLGADLAFGGNGTVFGSTAGNLVVPNDTDNGLSDIFTVDRSAGTIRGVTQGDTTPAFAGAPSNSLSVHGAINFADVDLTDTHTVQVIGNPTITAPSGFVVPQGGLGTFTPTVVETAGSGVGQVAWTLTVPDADTIGIGALQQVQQVYTLQLSDGHGGVVTQNVTVSIFGINDPPALTLPSTSASINANTSLQLTGAHVADPDAGDVTTLNLSVLNGSLTPIDVTLPAGITVDSSSPSALQVHGSAAAIDQLLNDGVTYTPTNDYVGGDTLTVAVHDTAGASDSKQVAITVNSVANQPAVVSGTSSGAVTEAGGVSNATPGTPTATGTLTDTDVDNPANTFQAVAAGTASDNAYGSYAMAAGGAWTYTLNNNNAAVQALNVGGTLTDTFTVHTADGTAQQVTVTINGANDAAVVSGTSSGAVTEAGGVSNATPGTPTATGTLTDTDVDNPANTFQAVAAGTASDNAYGSYAMAAGGAWTYTLNNNNAAVQALNVGGTLTDTFTVHTADGTAQQVTVTINGANDAAVVSGTSSGAVTEAGGVSNATPGTPTATGTLTDTDVDNPANTFQAVAAGTASDNAYGSYAMAAGGAWTYTLNNNNAAVQALNVGGTLTDTFTVHTADGTAQQVTVTINGANDAAVVSGTSSGAVTEAGGVSNATPGTPTATGTLTDTDVDNPANTFQAVAAGTASDNAYGSYAMAAGGAWTYTLNNNNAAVQALNVGGTLTDTFTVHTADGTAQQVTVTINGANDAAVVSGTSSGAVTEAGGVSNATPGTPTATGTLTDTDVDNPANTFQAVAAGTASDNAYGSYAMAAGGAWTYTLNNNNAAVQALNVGGTLTDTFTVHTADGTAQQVTVTINGANDAAVVSGTATAVAVDVQSLGSDGFNYTQGSYSLGFAFRANSAISITQLGYYDSNFTGGAETFTNHDVGIYDLNTNILLTSVTVGASDPVSGFFHYVSLASPLTLNTTDTYAIVGVTGSNYYAVGEDVSVAPINPAIDYLSTAYSASITSVLLQPDQFAENIFGTPPPPTTLADFGPDFKFNPDPASGSVTEAGGVNNGTPGTPTFSGTLTDTDVDNPANTFQAVAAGTASDNAYGSYAMAAGGAWTYTLNNNNAAVQALNVGGTLTDTFTVHTADGTAQQVTVTINGANDAAVVSGTSSGAVTEAGGVNNGTPGTPTFSGTLTDTDVDNPANTFQAVAAGTASDNAYGSYAMAAGGTWTYTLNNNNAAVQALNAGGTLSDTFTVHTQDGTAQQVTVTINGANDAPVAVNDTNTITAGNGPISGNLLANDSDPENDTLTVTNLINDASGGGTITVDGAYGEVVVAKATGNYTYTLGVTPNEAAAVAALAAGAQGQEDFIYTVSDGNGGTANAHLTIAVTGVNDAPALTLPGVTASTNKATPLALTGGHVADPDTGDVITLNLSVANGTLTPVDTVLPVGITVDDGNGADGTVQVHGSAAAIDQLLNDGVAYTPNAGFVGTVTMTVSVQDTAGATDSKQVPINVVDNAALSTPIVSLAGTNLVQEGAQLQAVATISGDSFDLAQTISYQWQSSVDGTYWTNIDPSLATFAGNTSFYQLTDADEGKQIRVVASFTDDTGQLISATSQSAQGPVVDAPPVLSVPFSYAVDEFSITKNGNPFYDNTFDLAPPYSTAAGPPGSEQPITFLTYGSTWSDVEGKAIMSWSGLVSNGDGVTGQVAARLTTNTDPSSTSGLKMGAVFTASGKFDLVVPVAGTSYRLELTDASSVHVNDEVVELRVANVNGSVAVQLLQENIASGTLSVLAGYTLSAVQLANNTQIELDLAHNIANTAPSTSAPTAGSTLITGSFELLDSNGVQTFQNVFTQQGTAFVYDPNDPSNGITWTRAAVRTVANEVVQVAGRAQVGQMLTAVAVTNDANNAVTYQWMENNGPGGTYQNISGATGANYVLQDADMGRQIEVKVTATNSTGTVSETSAPSTSVVAASSYFWGNAYLPTPKPGVHISSAAYDFDSYTGAGALFYYSIGPSQVYNPLNDPAGPYAITRSILPVDPFYLPTLAGVQIVMPALSLTLPSKTQLIVPSIITSDGNGTQIDSDGIAIFETQGQVNGQTHNLLYQVIGTGSQNGDTYSQLTLSSPPTLIVDAGSDSIYSMRENYRQDYSSALPGHSGSYLSSYDVAWDQYTSTGSYSLHFEIFNLNADGTPATPSGIINPAITPTGGTSLTASATAGVNGTTTLPAWQFRNAGGIYVLAVAEHDSIANKDFIQFKGYNTDGSANTNPVNLVGFTVSSVILPVFLASNPSATNHITQDLIPSLNPLVGSPSQQLAFVQDSVIGDYFIGWNETITDSSGSVLGDEVEFAVRRNTFGVNNVIQYQVPDAQNIRVATFTLNGTVYAVLVYGDGTTTHLVEFQATSGANVTQTVSITENTNQAFSSIENFGDGRIAVNYVDVLDATQTSQEQFTIYDFRTTGLNTNDANLADGQDKYFAGTHFTDAVTGENNVNNFYYYVGLDQIGAVTYPHDSFSGGNGGWNAAIFADARANYTIVNGVVTANAGNTAHAGTLTTSNVQALAFDPAHDPVPHSDSSVEATGDTLVILSSFNNAATIDPGATLEFVASDSGSVTFAGVTGTLRLDSPASFGNGHIDMLGSGDVLDLKGFDTNTTVTPGNFANGITTLTVSDPGHQDLSLTLAGDYSNSTWAVPSDGDSNSPGVAIHSTLPANDSAGGVLSGMNSSDQLAVAPTPANSLGLFTVTGGSGGEADWHFNASNNELIQLADQTQLYSVTDQTNTTATQTISVSVGANDQFEFQINGGTGTHAMVNFSAAVGQNSNYVGETISLVGFTNAQGEALTVNDILADLTSDSHGNAVVNLNGHDSITFEHVTASIVQAQAANIFHFGGSLA